MQIAEAHAEMPVADLAAIHIGLARFAGAVYPDDLEHVDAVLAACTQVRVYGVGFPAHTCHREQI